MKTFFVWTVYCLAIISLVLCVVFVILKLLITPPCTAITQGGTCTIDAWSLAGLAGTVLGVAATVLAFLGAFAVAAWWIKLEERVDQRVETLYKGQQEQINQQMSELRTAQANKFNEQTLQFQRDFQNLRKNLEELIDDQQKLRNLMYSAAKIQVATVLLNPPEDIEAIALQAVDLFKSPNIVAQMVFKYLERVEERFVNGLFIEDVNGKPSPNLLFFWERALLWQKKLEELYPPEQNIEEVVVTESGSIRYQIPNEVKQVQQKIDEYLPRVEEWKKNHGV